jgi:hypothetical protein
VLSSDRSARAAARVSGTREPAHRHVLRHYYYTGGRPVQHHFWHAARTAAIGQGSSCSCTGTSTSTGIITSQLCRPRYQPLRCQREEIRAQEDATEAEEEKEDDDGEATDTDTS